MNKLNTAEIHKIIGLIDLTSLNDNDSVSSVQSLCQAAMTDYGPVAAVCVYPSFVPAAREMLLKSPIKIATVANFPEGNQLDSDIFRTIESTLAAGADEIDLVIPYQQCLQGDFEPALHLVRQCKNICGKSMLKVIIETGAFSNDQVLAALSFQLLQAGADYLKTSTGKISVGVTMPAAEILLTAIVAFHQKYGVWRGFKASGGVREYALAYELMLLAERLCGVEYINSKTFRIGASSLLYTLLQAANN